MKTLSVPTFDVTVKIDRTMEDGMKKAVKELYVVEAFTPTDAEARILDFLAAESAGETSVTSAKKSVYNEIEVEAQGEWWYIANIELITLDEKSGKEKRTKSVLLVSAANFKAAHDMAMSIMSSGMADWELIKIEKSKICDFVGK